MSRRHVLIIEHDDGSTSAVVFASYEAGDAYRTAMGDRIETLGLVPVVSKVDATLAAREVK